jgi:hypothetical protein
MEVTDPGTLPQEKSPSLNPPRRMLFLTLFSYRCYIVLGSRKGSKHNLFENTTKEFSYGNIKTRTVGNMTKIWAWYHPNTIY